MAEPTPAKPLFFPIKFKVCLRLIIGGRLHSERLHIFRQFWCGTLKEIADRHAQYNEPYEHPTDEARLNHANLMIEKFNREGVEAHFFTSLQAAIPAWRRENRLKQRQNANRASWTQKARRIRKKRLQAKKSPKK